MHQSARASSVLYFVSYCYCSLVCPCATVLSTWDCSSALHHHSSTSYHISFSSHSLQYLYHSPSAVQAMQFISFVAPRNPDTYISPSCGCDPPTVSTPTPNLVPPTHSSILRCTRLPFLLYNISLSLSPPPSLLPRSLLLPVCAPHRLVVSSDRRSNSM